MLKSFSFSDINKSRWKELTKYLKNTHCPVYWLSDIPQKRADIMKITLLVDMHTLWTQRGYKVITAKYTHGFERMEEAFIPIAFAEDLANFLLLSTE